MGVFLQNKARAGATQSALRQIMDSSHYWCRRRIIIYSPQLDLQTALNKNSWNKIAVNIGKGLGWKSIELDVCHNWWLTINKIVLIPNWHDSGVWRYTFVNFVNFVELNMNIINIYIWLGFDFMRTCCSLHLFKMSLPNLFPVTGKFSTRISHPENCEFWRRKMLQSSVFALTGWRQVTAAPCIWSS